MQPGDILFNASPTSDVVRADVVTEIDGPTKFRGLAYGWQYARDWSTTLADAIQARAVRLEQEQASLRGYIRNYHNHLKQVNERIAAGPPSVADGFEEEQKKLLAEEYKKHYNKKPAVDYRGYFTNLSTSSVWANF